MTYAMQGRNHKEKIGETEDSPKFSGTLKDPILIKGGGGWRQITRTYHICFVSPMKIPWLRLFMAFDT